MGLSSKHLSTDSQVVSTYRCMHKKPQVISSSGSSFELFHRKRAFKVVLQCIGLVVLAVWTISNYVHVLRGL